MPLSQRLIQQTTNVTLVKEQTHFQTKRKVMPRTTCKKQRSAGKHHRCGIYTHAFSRLFNRMDFAIGKVRPRCNFAQFFCKKLC